MWTRSWPTWIWDTSTPCGSACPCNGTGAAISSGRARIGPAPDIDNRSAARALTLLNPRRLYHRAEIESADLLPAEGGAVIVSNHGRLDFDCFILVGLILRKQGRVARLMADHLWFGMPVVRRLWAAAGALEGTRENAARVLAGGGLVLTYPGGLREIMGSRFGHERIDWEGRKGFAEVAVAAGAPVIPVIGVGVNSGFRFLTSGRRLGRLLYQRLLRLGPAYSEYRDPLVIGLIPLPLPYSLAVHLPLPCKVRYVVGEALYPDAASADSAADLAARTAEAMRGLIARYGSQERRRHRAKPG